MFTISWNGGSILTPPPPQTIDETLDALENQTSETSPTKWLVRTVSLAASLQALKISRKYVGDGEAAVISLGTLILSRVLADKLLVQPKINRLREEFRLLSGQRERQQQASPESLQTLDNSASLQKLHDMVGLEEFKTHTTKLHQKMLIQKMRKDAGLKCENSSRGHIVFTGNPGTGKTMSAQLLTHILFELGVIKEDKFVQADRSALVGRYIGETAIKTETLVLSAQNGVLFIDEAYSLSKPDSEKDFGSEAVEKLLVMLEDPKVDTMVIMAGYPKQMEQLIESNPGFRSRVPKKIHFDDYSDEQLFDIFQFMCDKNGYLLADDAFNLCKEKLSDIKKHEGEHFANARSVRNFFELVQSAQECRLAREFSRPSDGSHETPPEDCLTPEGTHSVHPTPDVVKKLKEFSTSDLEAAATDHQHQSKPHDSGAWMDMYH